MPNAALPDLKNLLLSSNTFSHDDLRFKIGVYVIIEKHSYDSKRQKSLHEVFAGELRSLPSGKSYWNTYYGNAQLRFALFADWYWLDDKSVNPDVNSVTLRTRWKPKMVSVSCSSNGIFGLTLHPPSPNYIPPTRSANVSKNQQSNSSRVNSAYTNYTKNKTSIDNAAKLSDIAAKRRLYAMHRQTLAVARTGLQINFDTLGVSVDISITAFNKLKRELMFKYHPDRLHVTTVSKSESDKFITAIAYCEAYLIKKQRRLSNG